MSPLRPPLWSPLRSNLGRSFEATATGVGEGESKTDYSMLVPKASAIVSCSNPGSVAGVVLRSESRLVVRS